MHDKSRWQKPLFVRMSDTLWAQLRAEAERRGVNPSELTRFLIMEHCPLEVVREQTADAESPKN
jgi:hypothetical protein